MVLMQICSLLHLHAFGKSIFYRYLQYRLRSHRDFTYVLCPACDRYADATAPHGLDWTEAGVRRAAGSGADSQESGMDNGVESEPLLREGRHCQVGEQKSTIHIIGTPDAEPASVEILNS